MNTRQSDRDNFINGEYMKIISFFKKFFVVVFIIFTSNIFAQNKPDALKFYRDGRNLDSRERYEEAKESYNKAVEICKNELIQNPKNMDSYAVYTWSLFRLKRYEETIKYCNEALKITKDARIIETAGEALFYLRNYKESLRMMEIYIDMAPTGERISIAHFFIGEIYRLEKKYNKADIAYSIAVRLAPSHSLWWYRLGLAREGAGDKKEAKEAFQSALRLNPEYKEAKEGIKRVEA